MSREQPIVVNSLTWGNKRGAPVEQRDTSQGHLAGTPDREIQ
ncbi:MAG: hypothetical protein ABF747_07845 [Bifidobacterium sp.]|uniref:Uncharacterized protein n=1 Tax=Bifidobacterium fermentum TaxID=3059035 RepID=A0AB39UB72_9BIFI